MKYDFYKFVRSIVFLTLAFIFLLRIDVNAQYQRKVIFEEFSEVWCGPCAQLAPMLSAWLDNHPEINAIYYYSYFVVDGKQTMTNKEDYNARNQFYSVPFYPYARINAVLAPNESYPGYPTDTNRINYIIDTMTKVTPVELNITNTVTAETLKAKISITSDIDLNNKNIYVMLVEKEKNYAKQSNGQTHFHHIFRKSLSGSNGETFSIKAGETKDFIYEYNIKEYLGSEMIVTAIVQDPLIRYIYQSESSKVTSNICFEKPNFESEIFVSPNPINDIAVINLKDIQAKEIVLLDLLGNQVGDISFDSPKSQIILDRKEIFGSKINSGIYFIKIIAENRVYFHKIIFE